MSIAIVALLVSLLLPLLGRARQIAYRAVCANNLRQINVGWQGYVQDNKDLFPQNPVLPEWQYGGVEFSGTAREPVLAMDRPINKYLAEGDHDRRSEFSSLFHCPGDAGIFARGTALRGQPGASILPGDGTCFSAYGNSYRANPFLMDSTAAGLDEQHRPLSLHEIHVDTSRLLVTADPAWYYATIGRDEAPPLEASWHTARDSGNMLAVDGSIRFIDFAAAKTAEFALHPRPDSGR